MDCALCKRLTESEAYAKHYAEFYVHFLAEKEGKEKAKTILCKLLEAGVKVNYADAFCVAYKAAYERNYETHRKKFWDFFTDWNYHTASKDDKYNACGYHSEGFCFHGQFQRHPMEPNWDKETVTGYDTEETHMVTRSGRYYLQRTTYEAERRRERLRYHRCRVDEQLQATPTLPAGTPPPPPVNANLATAGTPPLWRFAAA